MNRIFYHKTVTTQQIENYLSEQLGQDLSGFFNQYLRSIKIPKLEYKILNSTIQYRYTNIVANFLMPLKVHIDNDVQWISPKEVWKTIQRTTRISDFSVDKNFYIRTKKIAN